MESQHRISPTEAATDYEPSREVQCILRDRCKSLFTLKPLTQFSRRDAYFALFLVCSLLVFWKELVALSTFSLSHDYASHILLVVPISAVLIYWNRQRIFSITKAGPIPGTVLLLTGIGLFWIGERKILSFAQSNELSVVTLAIVTIWIAGFILFYGIH